MLVRKNLFETYIPIMKSVLLHYYLDGWSIVSSDIKIMIETDHSSYHIK